METLGKEAILQKALGIAGWIRRRGHYFVLQDEKNFIRADQILDRLVEGLREFIKNEINKDESSTEK